VDTLLSYDFGKRGSGGRIQRKSSRNTSISLAYHRNIHQIHENKRKYIVALGLTMNSSPRDREKQLEEFLMKKKHSRGPRRKKKKRKQ